MLCELGLGPETTEEMLLRRLGVLPENAASSARYMPKRQRRMLSTNQNGTPVQAGSPSVYDTNVGRTPANNDVPHRTSGLEQQMASLSVAAPSPDRRASPMQSVVPLRSRGLRHGQAWYEIGKEEFDELNDSAKAHLRAMRWPLGHPRPSWLDCPNSG